MSYRTFTRTWWKENPTWPNGLEPCAGRCHYMGHYATEAEAQNACRIWNATHEAGHLSRKMEYDEV